jgi:hypothetical protein
LTAGKADTVSALELTDNYQCPAVLHKLDCTYSQSHRKVSKREHAMVYEEYNVPVEKRNRRSGEVDHLDPLCNGGSNDIENLWYQPAVNRWNGQNFGYHQKDDLEAWVCRQVKAGLLDPSDAFERITSDWVKFYLEIKPKHVKFSD